MNRIKNVFLFIIGSVLMGIAIALCYKINYGCDPLGVFGQGLALTLNISVALSSFIISIITIVIVSILEIKQIGLGTLLSLFFNSIGIQIGMSLIPDISILFLQIIGIAAIIVLFGISIALMVYANIGKSAYDGLIYALCNKTKKSYSFIRYIFDAIFLVSGILLKGVFGITTIILLLFVGKSAELFLSLIKR